MKTLEYNRKIKEHILHPLLKGKIILNLRVHEDGRLKKCFTTSKFNMNSVVKNTFFHLATALCNI